MPICGFRWRQSGRDHTCENELGHQHPIDHWHRTPGHFYWAHLDQEEGTETEDYNRRKRLPRLPCPLHGVNCHHSAPESLEEYCDEDNYLLTPDQYEREYGRGVRVGEG